MEYWISFNSFRIIIIITTSTLSWLLTQGLFIRTFMVFLLWAFKNYFFLDYWLYHLDFLDYYYRPSEGLLLSYGNIIWASLIFMAISYCSSCCQWTHYLAIHIHLKISLCTWGFQIARRNITIESLLLFWLTNKNLL